MHSVWASKQKTQQRYDTHIEVTKPIFRREINEKRSKSSIRNPVFVRPDVVASPRPRRVARHARCYEMTTIEA